MNKKIVITSLLVLGFVVLAIITLLTVSRLREQRPVAPTAPESKPGAATPELFTPKTYPLCPLEKTTEHIYTTNVGSRQIKGYANVQYVVGTSRVDIKRYVVDQVGDISLDIEYPPINEWQLHPDGKGEIHVDVSFEIYEGDIKTMTLGPGKDWDVFCTAPQDVVIPSPSPMVSATPLSTPRATPLSTPSATPNPTTSPGTGGTIYPSPTPTPLPTPLATPQPTPGASPNQPSPAPTDNGGTGGTPTGTTSSTTPAATPNAAPSYPTIPTSGTAMPTWILLGLGLLLLSVGGTAIFLFR